MFRAQFIFISVLTSNLRFISTPCLLASFYFTFANIFYLNFFCIPFTLIWRTLFLVILWWKGRVFVIFILFCFRFNDELLSVLITIIMEVWNSWSINSLWGTLLFFCWDRPILFLFFCRTFLKMLLFLVRGSFERFIHMDAVCYFLFKTISVWSIFILIILLVVLSLWSLILVIRVKWSQDIDPLSCVLPFLWVLTHLVDKYVIKIQYLNSFLT